VTGDADPSSRPARPGDQSVLARLEADGRLTLNPCQLTETDPAAAEAAHAVVETKRSETRHEILGEIARGGVGIVLRARDADLGRDVAMKIIRDEHLGNDDVLARFVEEAQIGGKLQHPGIVPVYELGLRPEGQPYFTMKLVKGRTFAQIFEERKDPTEGLRRLLQSFEAVCQTIAYAHARGVVHRDLKPLNVMVGAFGELQVVDWGLAKVLDQALPESKRRVQQADVSIIETVRGGESSIHSRVGSVLGTPAYMPPEQARGDVDAVDQRSDVFALGAILCEILTGKPPYTGDAGTLVQQAAEANLADAMSRLDACGADADVVALAKNCLAPAPAARPKDAGAVAARIAACFAAAEQRARGAQEEAAAATIRANTAARSRRLAKALAATVLVAAAAGIGGWVWYGSAQAQRVSEADRAVDAELREAAALWGKARASRSQAAWAEAVAAGRTAEATARSRGASEASGSLAAKSAESIRAESENVAAQALRDTRDRAAIELCEEIRLESWDVEESVSDARYAAAFQPFGIDPDRASPGAAAEAIRASASVGALATALEAWADVRDAIGRPSQVLRAAAREADPDPWRTRLRDAKTRDDLAKLAGEADVASLPPLTLVALGDALGNHGDVDGAVAILSKTQATHPGEFAVNSRLAYWLGCVRPRRAEETIRYALAALARRPGSAALWNNLGTIYADRNDEQRAGEAYAEALRLAPKFAAAHANRARLALAHLEADGPARKAGLDRVIAGCNEAIGIDKKCVTAYATLGDALMEKGDTNGALEALREGARVRPESSQAHQLVAAGLATMGRRAEAEAELLKSIELDPGNAAAHNDLGGLLMRRRDLEGALRHCGEATRLEPDNPGFLRDLSNAHWERRDAAAAIDAVRRIVRLLPTEPGAYTDLGYVLRFAGQTAAAVKATRVVTMFAGGTHSSQLRLAEALLAAGDVAGATSALEEALNTGGGECSGCGDRIRWGLADAHERAGLFATAATDLRRLRERHAAGGPRLAESVRSIDRALALVDRLEKLKPELPAFVSGARMPESAEDCLAVASYVANSGRGARASALYAAAFEREPSLAEDTALRFRADAADEAAAAGTGAGEGAQLDAAARARLRRLALGWLRADLAACERRLGAVPASDPSAVEALLAGWMQEPRIAAVRDLEAVAALPADEQVEWNALWRDVEALRVRVSR
jgi:tetratricopeptide (TPR) repeat protein/tRNA A-37 threonylcarbamoyl transferase component Bud32